MSTSFSPATRTATSGLTSLTAPITILTSSPLILRPCGQNGDILDERDGDPAGDGAYLKDPVGNLGAVYVVAGHGGKSIGGTGGHPVMQFTDVTNFGSLLLEINGGVLTLRNLLSNGSIADVFAIDKLSNAGPANKVVIRQPGADFPAGGSTTLEVMVQDAAGNRVSTDSTTQITFDPTLSGTISGVVTGTGDSSYGVAGGAETVTVMAGIARITLTDNVAETFQVAITNDASARQPTQRLDHGDGAQAVTAGIGLRFGEGSGTTTQDRSGNGNHGTLINGVGWVAGQMGQAVGFDGVNDYVETGNTANLPNWTISGWVRGLAAPSSASASGPIHRDSNYPIKLESPERDFRGAAAVQVGGNVYAASSGPCSPIRGTTWRPCYDGETLRAYKDGVLITSNTAPSGARDRNWSLAEAGKTRNPTRSFSEASWMKCGSTIGL